MKVTRIETLRCDAGWRMFSFLKVMTDEGLIGWSEYNESFGSHYRELLGVPRVASYDDLLL
jgi:hypothetical protein